MRTGALRCDPGSAARARAASSGSTSASSGLSGSIGMHSAFWPTPLFPRSTGHECVPMFPQCRLTMRVCAAPVSFGRLVAARLPRYDPWRHRRREDACTHARSQPGSSPWCCLPGPPRLRRERRRRRTTRSSPATSRWEVSARRLRRVEVQAQRARLDLERPEARQGRPDHRVPPGRQARTANRGSTATQGQRARQDQQASRPSRPSRFGGTAGTCRGPAGVTSLVALEGTACTRHDGASGTVDVATTPEDVIELRCTAGAPPPPPGAELVINEIDYDQVGADTAGFVEIANTGGSPAALDGIALVLVNGGDAAEYDRVDLTGTLAAGGTSRSTSMRRTARPTASRSSTPRPGRCSTRSRTRVRSPPL